MIDRRLLFACAAALVSIPALAQAPAELKIIAPAGPGGGWDTAARSIQQVLTGTGLARSVQVQNVTGAGGTPTMEAGGRPLAVAVFCTRAPSTSPWVIV